MSKVEKAFQTAARVLRQEKDEIYRHWLTRLESITPDDESARVAIAIYTHVPVIIGLLADSLEGDGLSSESEELRSISQFIGRQVMREDGALRACLQSQRLLQSEVWLTFRDQTCTRPDVSFDECIAVKEAMDSFMDQVLAGMIEGGTLRLVRDHQGVVLPAEHAVRLSASADGNLTEEFFVLGSVEALAAALDAKDTSTRHHSERTAQYAIRIAKSIGFDQEHLDELHHIAMLHDVGKIGIHDSVITKPGYLTVAERDLMRLHPTIGASILAKAQILDRMVPPVLHHHEWLDGTGYPARLKGDQIPLESRVLSVADAFDAMTSERTYRPRRPFDMAMSELRAKAGTQFDPEIVTVFESVVCEMDFATIGAE